MIVERLQPEKLRAMDLQPSQRAAKSAFFDAEYLEALTGGAGCTILTNDGVPVAASSVLDFEDGSIVVGFLASDAGKHMLGIVRVARRIIDAAKRPTYATAPVDFAPSNRLLRMLGFEKLDMVAENIDAAGGRNFVYVRR